MNTGQQTIDWLFEKRLRVDAAWSIRENAGFTWWADRHAQRVVVVGSEAGPDGNDGYFIRVKTELIRDLKLTERALAGINILMSTATMSGPVYDPLTGILSLSSLVRVHSSIRDWMSHLISVAAMLQIADAHFLGAEIAEMVDGKSAESGHPTSGLRQVPDELAVEFTPLMASLGANPPAWRDEEFQLAVDQYMQQLPSLVATAGGNGLTVEFPYGTGTSLCEMISQEHPRIGNGLLLLQSFPVERMSDHEGTKLALKINADELDRRSSGYGFGSYCYRDGNIHFTGFIPNLCYQNGLLPNLYFSCAERSLAMSIRFRNDDWSNPSLRL